MDLYGSILDVNKVKIINKNEDGIGEICVKGANVFDGYVGEKTKFEKDGFFNTEDLGYVKDNFLYVVGRKKNILIGDNGKNISPEELNNKILKYKGIDNCNIIMKDNKLIAVINSKLEKEEIKKIVNEVNSKLPRYKKITDFEIVEKNVK